jgi:hypothetical protein
VYDSYSARPLPGPPLDGPADVETIVAAVERSVEDLAGLTDLPVGEHVARFEATHAALTEALSGIDKV